jgi:hypothetical protein
VETETYVEVSYRGLERFFACPWKAVEEHVVARVAGVRLPGYVIEGLTTNMWNVLEVFDVTLRPSGTLDTKVTTTKM